MSASDKTDGIVAVLDLTSALNANYEKLKAVSLLITVDMQIMEEQLGDPELCKIWATECFAGGLAETIQFYNCGTTNKFKNTSKRKQRRKASPK